LLNRRLVLGGAGAAIPIFGAACWGASSLDAGITAANQIKFAVLSNLRTSGNITGVEWSADGRRLAAIGDFGREISVWERSGRRIAEIRANVVDGPYGGQSIAFLSNDVLLTPAFDEASLFAGQAFTLWNVSTQSVLHHIAGPAPGKLPGMNEASLFVRFNHGNLVAAAPEGMASPIWIYSTKDWRPFDQIPWHVRTPGEIQSCMAISPDGKMLAIGVLSGKVYFYDMRPPHTYLGALVVYPEGMDTPYPLEIWMGSLAFSPDGKYLAIGSGPSTGPSVINGGSTETEPYPAMLAHAPVQIWRIEDWAIIAQYPGHLAPVSQLSWSSDSLFLAAALGDNTVRIFTPSIPIKSVASYANGREVCGVAFAPNGHILAAAIGRDVLIFKVG
jgi:WD40 repeat protein